MALVAYSLTVSFPLVLVTDNLYVKFPEVLFPASQLPPSPGYSYFVPGTFLRAKFFLYGQKGVENLIDLHTTNQISTLDIK